MSSDRLQRLEDLYHAALARPADKRATFLRAACVGDSALYDEVQSLLGHAALAEEFLEHPPVVPAAPLPSGAVLGSYVLVEQIGAGGMGVVYRARDEKLRRPVAIKVLTEGTLAGEAQRARFVREARAASALNHPNIIAIYDIDTAAGCDYIAMEYVAGTPLHHIIPKRGLSADRALDLARQIVSAIAAAHARGLVHRDLKPANILVTADGHAKVIDFGLAKHASAPTGDATMLTQTDDGGRVIGTPGYAAPEQMAAQAVDARIDVFALGAILYELLVGRRAFEGTSSAAVLAAVLRDTPPPLGTLRHDIPRGLQRIVSRCLEKNADSRYPSAVELFDDLKREQARLSARRVRLSLVLRRPAVALTLASILLAILASAGWFWWRSGSRASLHQTMRPFATGDNAESMPAWSPDGRTLAYSAEIDGYYQIVIRQVDGSVPNPVRLTQVEEDCLFPAWDSTGTRIYFLLSKDQQHREIRSISTAGGEPVLVVPNVQTFAVGPSDVIAFLRAGPEGAELWLKDKGGLRRSGTLPFVAPFLAFSPDGQWLGMTDSSGLPPLGPHPFGLQLVPHPFDSTALEKIQRVTFDQANVWFYFAWMPDTRRVIFSGLENASSDPQLWVGDIKTGTAQRLGNSQEWQLMPALSHDGTRAAFMTTPTDFDVVEIDLAVPRFGELIAGTRYEGWPAWVPNGNAVVFVTKRTGRFEIWRRDLATAKYEVLVTPDLFSDGPASAISFLAGPDVSSDGQRLVYARKKVPMGWRIYFQAISGTQPVKLTDLGPDAKREDLPSWSPDARWVVFRMGRRIMKAPATGNASAVPLAGDAVSSELAVGPRWIGNNIFYPSAEGIRRMNDVGGDSVLLTRLQPLVWDVAGDGTIVGILEGKRRAMKVVRISGATGALLQEYQAVGQFPVPLNPAYGDPVRGLRVSPDGTRLVMGYTQPRADIWIREGLR